MKNAKLARRNGKQIKQRDEVCENFPAQHKTVDRIIKKKNSH
jgi:hypothetical protein